VALESLSRIVTVAGKESRHIRRDPLSLAMLLGVPGMMVVLYGFALNFDVKNIALAISDRDQSEASRSIAASFTHSGYFVLKRFSAASLDLEALMKRREATAILVVPEGFGETVAAGRRAELQLLLDGSNSNTATTALNYASALVGDANERLLARRAERAPPIQLRPRVWYNPELESSHFLVPGLMGFILMITSVVATALSVVREKERGTMEQIRLAPLRMGELIAGKTLPYLFLSLVASAIILVVARAVFGVSVRGSYTELFAATTLYLTGALGWGLFVSTLATTQQQAFQIAMLSSMLPAVLLSGFVFPIRSMPVLMQYVSYAVPARYYLVVSRGIILKGSSITLYPRELLLLLAYTVVVLTLATVGLRRKAS